MTTPPNFVPTLDDLDDEAIEHLGKELGVQRQPNEGPKCFRERVERAWKNDDAIDATNNPPVPFVLGGFKLGG